ncbi:hypothetical protein [Nonomuraea sp. NEAU-A123]|nr:hypothetical protein [Nonomuraea sp. NEAU-A123]
MDNRYCARQTPPREAHSYYVYYRLLYGTHGRLTGALEKLLE